jgi:AraC family transcriptional regulator, transcriptional activator of pobA
MKNIPLRHINATQKEPSFPGNFSIRNVRDLLAGKDMVQELHRHDFFYLLALKKGKGNHTIDFTLYEACDNSLFFMYPGQVHQITLKAASTGYLMGFEADFYYPRDKISNQFLRKATSLNSYQFDAVKFKKLFSILTYIFQEYTAKQGGYQEVIKANLEVLFIELVRHNNKMRSGSVNPYARERLQEFLELLATRISNLKQVSEYAENLNISTYQLNAITKETLGKTASEVINEYIILESKRYLLATSNLVNQIAHHLGYDDVSYFIRFFKKHTGYSPEAFRYKFR